MNCPQKVRYYLGVFLWKEKSSMLWGNIKLLLPEIIVDYSEQTSYKKAEEIFHLHLKEINSIPKE